MSYLFCSEVFCDKTGADRMGRLFRFPLDPGDGKFHYRARTAINAFFYGKKKRNHNGSILYYAQDEEFYSLSEQTWKKTCELNNLPHTVRPVVELNSVFELFAAIGFDNKTKKYNTP